jgi:hypothetical protein
VALSLMWCRAPRTIPLTRRRSVARKYADRESRHIGCEIRNLEERPDMIGPMMKPSVLVLRERQSRALAASFFLIWRRSAGVRRFHFTSETTSVCCSPSRRSPRTRSNSKFASQ